MVRISVPAAVVIEFLFFVCRLVGIGNQMNGPQKKKKGKKKQNKREKRVKRGPPVSQWRHAIGGSEGDAATFFFCFSFAFRRFHQMAAKTD